MANSTDKQWTPPPGWPEPPAGWSPPEGWQPDPGWPPVPPGWEFWRGPEISLPYLAPRLSGKPKKMAEILRRLEPGEEIVALARANKITPSVAFVAITDRRALAGGLLPGQAPVASLPLAEIGSLATHGFMKNLTVTRTDGRTIELGALLDDDLAELEAAIASARRAAGSATTTAADTGVTPGAEAPAQPLPGGRPVVSLTKPPAGARAAGPTLPPPPPPVPASAPSSWPASTSDPWAAALESARQDHDHLAAVTTAAVRTRTDLAKALDHSRAPRKIKALGAVTRVVLHDLELHIAGTVIALTPALRASASTSEHHDDQTLVLQVDWPGGTKITTWTRNKKKVSGAFVDPAGLYAMVAAINTAAAHSDAARASRAAGTRGAARKLLDHLDRSTPDVTGRRETVRHSEAGLRAALDAASVARASMTGRDTKPVDAFVKAGRKQLTAVEKAVDAAEAYLVEVRHQRPGLERTASDDVRPPATPSRPAVAPAPAPAPARTASAPPVEPTPDPIKLLTDLGALRDAGVLTQAEFDQKKSEILGRI